MTQLISVQQKPRSTVVPSEDTLSDADNEYSDQTAQIRGLVRVFVDAHVRRDVIQVATHMMNDSEQ